MTIREPSSDPEEGSHPYQQQQQQQQQQQDIALSTISSSSSSNNTEDRYLTTTTATASHSYDDLRLQHWKESKYAVGLTHITWNDSFQRASVCSGPWWQFCCCSTIHAGRIGNMAVLLKGDDGFRCIVGPYWPCLAFVTIPLIVIVSGVAVWRRIRSMPWWFIVVWSLLTIALFVVLFLVSCRDPGILKRYSEIPDDATDPSGWHWNDQGRTYRPPKAKYDSDCAVVVEEFDHTCPWTGTAIGKNNMPAFRMFFGMVLVVLVVDIVVLVGPF